MRVREYINNLEGLVREREVRVLREGRVGC